MKLVGAWIQCGAAPPYTCLAIPTRMLDNKHPQVRILEEWHDFPQDRDGRPIVTEYLGAPVAGIASEWDYAG